MQNLITKVINKDVRAQELFYKQFARKLYVVCLRYLANEDDASDVLNSAFFKIFESLSKLQYINDKALEGWLRKIVINESLMFLRQVDRNEISMELLAEKHTLLIKDENELDEKDCLKLIACLPQGYRSVFNLFVVEGFNHQEISELLGISESTSRSQLFRAREFLKGIFEKHYTI
jgi:RNA polymerase sigma-70 factor (ECF subfamily)